MEVVTAPTRPALRYYGSKWKLAPWIISHFPAHSNYVEPCGGAASVLLQKPRSPLETYNDIDGNVVNFFRVLRDQPDELIKALWLTPWARQEYENSLEIVGDDVERARRFFIISNCNMHRGTSPGVRDWQRWTTAGSKNPRTQNGLPSELKDAAKRLWGVQIENESYDYVIRTYDASDTLFYFDPPYLAETRRQSERYAYEWGIAEHERAAHILSNISGYVVVSGYSSSLYADIYSGWRKVDRVSNTNGGGKRTESLWLSPRTWDALNDKMSGLPLFN